ncbi:CBS domain-containing protein [Candidatus Thorarchaeota archaeon]|nr:MAG: CBS domain-containing protein [Candidatus Thorarchaeota archaeon]
MTNPAQHSMSVRDIMTHDVVTMAPTATVFEVAKTMTDMDIGSIVIAEGERPLGIISETDLIRRVIAREIDPQTTAAREIMSAPLIHVTPATGLTEAMRVMAKSGIRRLIVLKNHTLAGILTSRDILQWSPELIDILVESLRVRGEPARREVDEDELVAYGGICDSCGEYSTDLAMQDGRYLCESCRS